MNYACLEENKYYNIIKVLTELGENRYSLCALSYKLPIYRAISSQTFGDIPFPS